MPVAPRAIHGKLLPRDSFHRSEIVDVSAATGLQQTQPTRKTWTDADTPTQAHLQSVDMVSADDGWAVGIDGTIVRWDGSTWSNFESPTLSYLISVNMVSEDDGWAVGQRDEDNVFGGGRVIHWDGTAWSEVENPSEVYLFDVDFVSKDEGWAVGDWFTILHYDGMAWTTVTSAVNRDGFVTIDMVSRDDGWAAGSRDVLHWDGSTWRSAAPPGYNRNNSFSDLAFIDSDEGWAVGSFGGEDLIMRWGPQGWTRMTSPYDRAYRSIDLVSATDGWAVGEDGVIVHWDGLMWNAVRAPSVGANLNSVDMVTSDDGWAVGRNGLIMRCCTAVEHDPLLLPSILKHGCLECRPALR